MTSNDGSGTPDSGMSAGILVFGTMSTGDAFRVLDDVQSFLASIANDTIVEDRLSDARILLQRFTVAKNVLLSHCAGLEQKISDLEERLNQTRDLNQEIFARKKTSKRRR